MGIRIVDPKFDNYLRETGESLSDVLEMTCGNLSEARLDNEREQALFRMVAPETLLMAAQPFEPLPYSSLITGGYSHYPEQTRRIRSVDSMHEVFDSLIRKCDFNQREEKVFRSWIENGIRGNTVWMMRYLFEAIKVGEAMNPSNSEKVPTPFSRRFIAATFFTDIFNRADNIFDDCRDHFETRFGLDLSPMEMPVTFVDGEDPATLGESVDVFWKILHDSGSYSDAEVKFLRKEFISFMQTSLHAMRNYESLKTYGEKKAVQLRGLTLRTLSTFMTNVLYTSKFEGSIESAKREIGYEIAEAMSRLALITQIRDDILDFNRDFNNHNTNLVIGVANDVGEQVVVGGNDYETMWPETLAHDYPKTAERLCQLKQELEGDLPERYKQLSYRFNLGLDENWNDDEDNYE